MMEFSQLWTVLLLVACRSAPVLSVAPAPVDSPLPTGEDTSDTALAPTGGASTLPAVAPTVLVAPTATRAHLAEYAARVPKSVLEAQLYRNETSIAVTAGGRSATATLIDLAPTIHVWLLLKIDWADGTSDSWHLENPSGVAQGVRLDGSGAGGLILTRLGKDYRCEPWSGAPTALDAARATGTAYASLCDGALSVRNTVTGVRSPLEWTTDALRDHVWGGETITNAVKTTFYKDSERVTADIQPGSAVDAPATVGAPGPARVDELYAGGVIDPAGLGLPVDGAAPAAMGVGDWYPLHNVPGAWVSVLEPRFVAADVLTKNEPYVRHLDAVESSSLVYTVAYDLSSFDFGYEVGTDHPRVDWSTRVPRSVVDPTLPGPDGFGDVAPLVRAGELDPAFQSRLVSVFVSGFRRVHGAFRDGDLALKNSGSHYGFVEFGTELSHLQPGLATFVVWADGRVELRTWTEADASRTWDVRHARQNGVAILEPDAETGEVRPGKLVKDWTDGNWSGSVEGDLRSVRSGICIQDTPAGRFLLYSYFSTATPSAMADVFAAYGCSYAMLLDMNALEHTYLSVEIPEAGQLDLRHLVDGMEVLDRTKHGRTYPRFIGFADNRDFFYVLRKTPATTP